MAAEFVPPPKDTMHGVFISEIHAGDSRGEHTFQEDNPLQDLPAHHSGIG